MKRILFNRIFLISLLCIICSCSDDDLSYQDVELQLISQVTNEPLEGIEMKVISRSNRGSGIFSTNYDVDETFGVTNSDGYARLVVKHKNDSFFTIYVQSSTSIIEPRNSFSAEDVNAQEPLSLIVRKFHPLEVRVKNVNPFDSNDQISVSFYHQGSNFSHAPLYDIENRGDANEPYDDPSMENGLRPLWRSNNVDATIYKRVQEGTEARISWTVIRNDEVTHFQSEFIPTNVDGITYYEINY